MPRRTGWADTRISLDVASGGQLTKTLIGDFAVHETSGMTLTRCIYRLAFFDDLHINEGNQFVDWGIATASQEAFAAGVVSDPDNQSDHPVRGWIVRDSLVVASNVAPMKPTLIRGEVRSQRKIDGSELFLVVDNNPAGGTAFTMNVRGLIRCLCLLP